MSLAIPRLTRIAPLFCALALLAVPPPAHACSGAAPQVAVVGWTGVREVTLEGVIVLQATRGGAADVPDVVLRDGAGAAVPGEVSLLELRPQATRTSPVGALTDAHPVLLVWRSDAPLTAEANYSIEVTQAAPFDTVEVFNVVASASAYVRPEQPAFEAAMATQRRVSLALDLSCEDVTDMGPGACPNCDYTDYEDTVEVRVALPTTSDDAYSIHRLVPDGGDAIERDRLAWTGSEPAFETASGALYFLGEAETYCFHVESESLVDGSVLTGPRTCVAAADVADDPTMAGGCSVGAAPGSRFELPLFAIAGALLFWRRR
ncbi:MAG: hypothetical protein AB8I08_19650 [Sandaracinaceae bacterium]